MRKELAPEGEAAMSSKKRKRLDAYIAKKLKQEEMHESLRIIAANALALPSAPQSSASASNALSTLGIKSTKTLGQFPFNPLSALELADRKEDLVVRKAMVGAPGGDQRRKGRRARAGAYENTDNMDGDDDSEEDEGREDTAGNGEPIEEDERAIKKRKKAERNGIVVSVGGSGDPANPSASRKPKKAQSFSSRSQVKVRALVRRSSARPLTFPPIISLAAEQCLETSSRAQGGVLRFRFFRFGKRCSCRSSNHRDRKDGATRGGNETNGQFFVPFG